MLKSNCSLYVNSNHKNNNSITHFSPFLQKISYNVKIKNHSKNRVAILRIRYAGSFEYSFDVEEEELLSCLVPKLILQPLAENSVMHGSSDDGSVMEILITCWEENNHLIIELCDNGKGFEVTPAALEPHTNRKKIGITNVNDRIQLNFGKEYGLKVNSHPGEGTTCTLTLPLLYVQELSKDYNN